MTNNQKIINAIDQAIESKSEKTFLDFKCQWHEKDELGNTELVHDILCLCNCEHQYDRYLVVGIADNFYVKGVIDNNKRNLKELTDLMSNFNKIPNVEVQEIPYQGSVLNVIIIKYDNNHIRPFYIQKLTNSQRKVIENDLYKGLSAGAIYSRNNDTNTPKESTANKFEIERMWREHFGIDKSVLERFKIYLEKPEDWEDCGDDYYYKYFPEFKIINSDFEGKEERRSSYLKIDNPPASGKNRYVHAPMNKVILQYHSTNIHEEKLVHVYYLNDNGTTEIANPDHKFFDQDGLFEGSDQSGKYLFFFIFEESFLYRISKFLVEKQFKKMSGGVFCYDVSDFDPNHRFIFVLKGDHKENNIITTIEELSKNKEKMNIIKSDSRFVFGKK